MFDGRHYIQQQNLLYQDIVGRDACGVGGIGSHEGKPSRELIEKTLLGIRNLEHRGGVCGDSGDGAGMCSQLPKRFFHEEVRRLKLERYLKKKDRLTVGVFFFHDREEKKIEAAKQIIKEVITEKKIKILGWRTVPTNDEVLTDYARKTKPAIEQLILLTNNGSVPALERKLFKIRHLLQYRFREADLNV